MFLFVLGSIALTIGTLVYQHLTGPTYEYDLDVEIGGVEYDFDLPRSWGGESDAPINLVVPDRGVKGMIYWKKYPTNDDYSPIEMSRVGDTLKAHLPEQPPAGKLAYYFVLKSDTEQRSFLDDHEPVIIRYKGHVPLWILRIHIFLMFASMFLSNMTGLLAVFKHKYHRLFAIITMVTLFFGGMVMGPIVQKYAFGVFWSGVPFGFDLTDNKLLLSFLVWFIAVIGSWKKDRYYLSIIATILLIMMYAIPHSAMGSELDHETGELGTSERLIDKADDDYKDALDSLEKKRIE